MKNVLMEFVDWTLGRPITRSLLLSALTWSLFAIVAINVGILPALLAPLMAMSCWMVLLHYAIKTYGGIGVLIILTWQVWLETGWAWSRHIYDQVHPLSEEDSV